MQAKVKRFIFQHKQGLMHMLAYLSKPIWMVAVCCGPTSVLFILKQWNWGSLSTATLIFVVPCSKWWESRT